MYGVPRGIRTRVAGVKGRKLLYLYISFSFYMMLFMLDYKEFYEYHFSIKYHKAPSFTASVGTFLVHFKLEDRDDETH